MSDCWSPESRIWKSCGRLRVAVVRAQQAIAQAVERADPHAARVDRQHRGKAREHLARGLVGERDGEDPAGLTCPVWIRYAMRVVRTRVLPLPAPARMRAHWRGRVTARCCSGLRFARMLDIWGGENGVRDDFPTNRARKSFLAPFFFPQKRRAPEGALNCLPQLLVPRPKA
jgi:hypothetical protein